MYYLSRLSLEQRLRDTIEALTDKERDYDELVEESEHRERVFDAMVNEEFTGDERRDIWRARYYEEDGETWQPKKAE